MHLDRTTRRILGSLIEKRYSTPEQYPLTLNALVLACNQKSNRDPEMQLEEFLVEGCLKQLRIDGWVTIVEREYGRAVRYAERLVEKLGLRDDEAAMLAELMLRGPQTEQELPRRTERMVKIPGSDSALATLNAMAARGLVVHLPREPGQRVARWRHLLTPPDEELEDQATEAGRRRYGSDMTTTVVRLAAQYADKSPAMSSATSPASPLASSAAAPPTASASPTASAPDVHAQIASLRAQVEDLRARIARLEAR